MLPSITNRKINDLGTVLRQVLLRFRLNERGTNQFQSYGSSSFQRGRYPQRIECRRTGGSSKSGSATSSQRAITAERGSSVDCGGPGKTKPGSGQSDSKPSTGTAG